jgi:hypothetical protein
LLIGVKISAAVGYFKGESEQSVTLAIGMSNRYVTGLSKSGKDYICRNLFRYSVLCIAIVVGVAFTLSLLFFGLIGDVLPDYFDPGNTSTKLIK